MENMRMIALAPIFILLLVIIFPVIKLMLDFNGTGSFILAVCVSILAVIGMARYLNDTIDVILLPYAAMVIAILLILFLSVVARCFKSTKDLSSNRTRKNTLSRYDDERSIR